MHYVTAARVSELEKLMVSILDRLDNLEVKHKTEQEVFDKSQTKSGGGKSGKVIMEADEEKS